MSIAKADISRRRCRRLGKIEIGFHEFRRRWQKIRIEIRWP